MKVISNTSPLIGFAKIARLPLLQQLFHQLLIPQKVYDEFFDECTSGEALHFHAVAPHFITTVKVEQVSSFSRRLHSLWKNTQILSFLMIEKPSTKPWNCISQLCRLEPF
ncbi:hypothetical protein CSB45_11865 [candidate division KSB3 bacterium]|uniref:DUF3368 domain-containing protein n=1 Tax=candidate division KSB3 bacterium TaxID=2044937 RepID=A0A2G6E2N6_9BACT|nr:MAG: hypothetical protein CSB45_11865 [candidate division KSB3 bacterium]PIE29248.1 MAG: hypothetical protein CSA57_09585 [candidate division KSB3 bacterium]